MSEEKINLELINYKIDTMSKEIIGLREGIENKSVSKVEFNLRVGRLEAIVYGVVGVMGFAIVGAIINFFVKQ